MFHINLSGIGHTLCVCVCVCDGGSKSLTVTESKCPLSNPELNLHGLNQHESGKLMLMKSVCVTYSL